MRIQLIGVFALVMLVAIGIVLIVKKKLVHLGRVLVMLGICAVIGVALLIALLIVSLAAPNTNNPNFYTYPLVGLAVSAAIACGCALWGVLKKKAVYIPLIVCAAACLLVMGGASAYYSYIESIPTVGDSNLLYDYAPYASDTKVAELDEESELRLTTDLPKLDGATALYPVYSAFAKAVYPKAVLTEYLSEQLNCRTTAGAYKRIVDGKADIIFVAAPSEEQKAYAKSKGVELQYTPIGKEAFVFFVNSQNPINGLTIPQIQDIYSGKITDWRALEVNGLGKIKAFQREEGSGSQSALLRLMGDKPLRDAPTEVINDMGGIIEQTADYKNYKNAIGYSFRFYSTEMVQNNRIKLLSINGVAPTLETIKNGSYPISSYFYAVTRKDCTDNTKKLLDWIQGEQGRQLIERTGYTPIK